MERLNKVSIKRVGSVWSAKINGVQIHNSLTLAGERGLIEYIRTHYVDSYGQPIPLSAFHAYDK
jgi:hypothetical protein